MDSLKSNFKKEMMENTKKKYNYNAIIKPSYDEISINTMPATATDFTEAQLNEDGGVLTINVSSYNNPLDISKSSLYAEFEIYKDAAKTALANEDTTLIHNFFPYLFSRMILGIASTPVETIVNPGYADTILRFITTSYDYRNKGGEISGWIPDEGTSDTADTNVGRERRKALYNTTKKGSVVWSLSPLFGFTEYTKPLYKIPFYLELQRQVRDTFVFHADAVASGGHIYLKKLQWRIPSIRLAPTVEKHIIDQVTKEKTFDILFKIRRVHITDVSTTVGETTITLVRANQPPRYIFVVFIVPQAAYTTNNALLNKGEIDSIQLNIGSDAFYPSKPIVIKYADNIITQIYEKYLEVCHKYYVEPQLSMIEFRDFYPIYCFDTSAQDIDVVRNGADITLTINKVNVVAGTKLLSLYLEDNHWVINNEDGKMTSITYKPFNKA